MAIFALLSRLPTTSSSTSSGWIVGAGAGAVCASKAEAGKTAASKKGMIFFTGVLPTLS
jgi:hypothetical protein